MSHRAISLPKVVVVTKDDIRKSLKKPYLDSIHEEQMEERQTLKKLSDQKVSSWKSTVAGKRKQQILERQLRLEAEEELRKKQDELFAQEKESERQEVVQRAKELMFWNSEPGRILRREFQNELILLERDLQIQHKQQLQKKKNEYLNSVNPIESTFYTGGSISNEDMLRKRREIDTQFAQNHLKQLQEQLERKRAKELVDLQLEQETMSTFKFAQDATQRLEKVREQQSELNKQQFEAKEAIKQRKQQEKVKSIEELQSVRETAAKDEEFKKTLRDHQEKLRMEALQARDLFVASQAKDILNRNSKRDQWIDERIKEHESKHKDYETRRIERKLKEMNEVRNFFQSLKLENEMKAKEKEESNKKIREDLEKERAEYENETIRKATDKRKEILALQSNNADALKSKKDFEFAILEKEERLKNRKIEVEESKKEISMYIDKVLDLDIMKANPHRKSKQEYLDLVKKL